MLGQDACPPQSLTYREAGEAACPNPVENTDVTLRQDLK